VHVAFANTIAMTDTLRIESLELKCMDLENTVQALNEQLIRQYRDMERLTQQLQRLEGRVDTLQSSAPGAASDHEVPPHY